MLVDLLSFELKSLWAAQFLGNEKVPCTMPEGFLLSPGILRGAALQGLEALKLEGRESRTGGRGPMATSARREAAETAGHIRLGAPHGAKALLFQ